jgi:hypothetical protein
MLAVSQQACQATFAAVSCSTLQHNQESMLLMWHCEGMPRCCQDMAVSASGPVLSYGWGPQCSMQFVCNLASKLIHASQLSSNIS